MSMNDAQTIAELAQSASGATIVKTEDGRSFLVTRDGFTSNEVTDPHGLKPTSPRYIAQTVTLETKDSLVDYTDRFMNDASMLFASIAENRITAMIDYHQPLDEASNTAHRASMHLPFSEEWRVWTGVSGRLMPQLEFARFIEENAGDVVAPAGADLLEAIRDLQAHRKVNFIKAVRTSSDNENFEYTDETEARTKGGVEIPTKFKLSIPVYFGEPPTEVYAFLRWRLDEGALTLGIQIHRAEHIRQAVFKQIVMTVGERTGAPVVFGKPS